MGVSSHGCQTLLWVYVGWLCSGQGGQQPGVLLGWLGLDLQMRALKWQTDSGCWDLASTAGVACRGPGELEVFTQSSQTQA